MTTEIVIGIAAVVGLAIIIAFKWWLYKTITFKMDESIIINFLQTSDGNKQPFSSEEIAVGTHISRERVDAVCARSNSIMSQSEHGENWHLQD